MATIEDGSWQIGIGDPTPLGWITVAAYAVAALASWRCHAAQGARSANRFWLLLTLAMAALGINKQLDLQTALTVFGRAAAKAQGWYEQRHPVQIAFIGGVAVAGMVTLGALLRLAWPLAAGRALALCGVVFLAVFVLIRASSFNHVDQLLSTQLLGLSVNGVLELGGIAGVALGAWLDRHAATTRRPAPQ